MVGWGTVFVGSPGNVELAVGDDFVVISFLAQGGGAEDSSLEQNSSGEAETVQHVKLLNTDIFT